MGASRAATTLRIRPPSAVLVAIVRPTPEGVALPGRTPHRPHAGPGHDPAQATALPAPARSTPDLLARPLARLEPGAARVVALVDLDRA